MNHITSVGVHKDILAMPISETLQTCQHIVSSWKVGQTQG